MPPPRARRERLRRHLARRFSSPPPTLRSPCSWCPPRLNTPRPPRLLGGVALEIAYDPAVGPFLLTGGPHKIMLGPAVEV